MNESHASCRNLYNCSSENLDELTQLAHASGALGSRLTGAGWGGCCVSLVRNENVKDFIYKMQEYYLKEREPEKKLWVSDDLDMYLFETQVSRGACVLDPQFSLWL